MGVFQYNEEEKKINKVIKYNQELSKQVSNDAALCATRSLADDNIAASENLLASLGYGDSLAEAKKKAEVSAKEQRIEQRPQTQSWGKLVSEAQDNISTDVILEDILSSDEISAAFQEIDSIEKEFSRQTSIVNKTDLSFLATAIGLQTAKALLFPFVAGKVGYGDSFDATQRLAHNDKSIKQAQRQANDRFRDDRLNGRNAHTGYWINILYQTPPYDTAVGSAALNIKLHGKYHRLYTLGHDPLLGWLFGTANILTDIITLNTFQSYRVTRVPKLAITPQAVSLMTMFQEAIDVISADALNLPAALFAQAQHLKSDEYTKIGLPVPVLATLNEEFASKLYEEQYDALCFSRDTKITGISYFASLLIDMIISLLHGLFRPATEEKSLYEVRTRRILLISNSIASTSTIINACITKNPKNLDVGSLLSLLTHLVTDVRFIARVKQEFIESELSKQLQATLNELDEISNTI